jgi:DNA repair exonuclease SbcCD ATPase subunit
MRNTSFAIAICLCVVTGSAFGQKLTKDQKKEAKEIKKQMSNMDPFEFKKIMEENNTLRTEVSGLNDKVTSLQQEIASKEADLQTAQNQLQEASAKQAVATEASATTVSTKGVVFKVQIGAFKNKNLEKYVRNNPNFSGETDTDGTKKYTIGYFRDYWEADTFKKYLREMGVKDAWIVPYRDGDRVALKDVLEEQQLKKIKS